MTVVLQRILPRFTLFRAMLAIGISVAIFPITSPGGTLIAGDLAPRGAPDSALNAADVLILQRIILNSITPTDDERLVGDVAPLGNPDGVLNAADLVVLTRAVLGSLVLPPIDDNEPPSPANSDLISVSAPTGGNATITGAPGSADGFSTITLVNYSTGYSTTVTADAVGGFAITVPAVEGQVYAVVVSDRAGNSSNSISVGIGQLLELTITSPTNSSQVADDAVLVTGTFTGPAGTAVRVNGQVACTSGNLFYAENISLGVGNNDIIATASTPDGLSLSRSVQVTSAGPAPYQVRADAGCGYAPHNAVFELVDNEDAGIQQFDADFNDDGVIDLTATTPGSFQYAYSLPGVYTAVFTTTDTANGVYTNYQTIVVGDTQSLDAHLRATFSAFLDRLRVGAIDGALNYLAEPMRSKYEPMFREIQGDLPALVDQLGTLEDGGVSGRVARYTVVRDENGTPVGFPLFFIEDGDGVWRIGDM